MSEQVIPLHKIACGDNGIVVQLDSRSLLYGRFKELGIIEGVKIKKIMTSPLGDPSAYLVKEAIVAIRHSDASGILVEREENNVKR